MTSEDKNWTELQRRLNLLRSTSSNNNSRSVIIDTPTTYDEQSPDTSAPSSPILSPEEELALNEEMASYLNNASLLAPTTNLSPSDIITEEFEAQLKSFETKLLPSLPSIPSTFLPNTSSSSSSSKPFLSSSISPIEILYLSPASTSTSTSDSNLDARESHEDDRLITRILDELSLENHGLAQDQIQVDSWEERLSRLGKGIDLSGVGSTAAVEGIGGGGGGGRGITELPSSVDEFERRRKKIEKRKKKGKKKGSSSESTSESSESESSDSDSD